MPSEQPSDDVEQNKSTKTNNGSTMTTDNNDELPEKLQTIKNDRSKALRSAKDIGDDADPDAHHVDDPRTAVRFDTVKDGVPIFDVVTTKLSGFPLGKNSYTSGSQDEITDWVRRNNPEIIDAEEEQWSKEVATDGGVVVEEHPTPKCPNCGNRKTRPIDREWASCFDCEHNWKMTEEVQEKVAEEHWDA